ncbi:MAG: hypothetical protein IIX95_03285 [Clostridiales bacterium]|nr:hypothetical protein [Clostridiales bacterium]
MSENISIINNVNTTSTEVKCPSCGASGGIKYDPATSTLTCPFCGHSSELQLPARPAEELDFNAAIQRANVNWGYIKKLIVCSNCGGQTLYDAEQVTGACPFCGSTSVAPAAENEQIMAPNAVIPFTITQEMTQQCFVNFLQKKSRLCEGVMDCKLENITGVYLPYWTFDVDTVTDYVVSTGNYIPEGYTNSQRFSGVFYQTFDDLFVFASDKIRNPYLPKIQRFDFSKAVPYSPKYLAGYAAERYTVGLNDAFERAKKKIPRLIDRDISIFEENAIKCRAYVDKATTTYYNAKYRYLLAPVYIATYRYKKNKFQVAINGQTGQTYCDAPSKWPKMIITLAIAGGITYLILMILITLFPDFFSI